MGSSNSKSEPMVRSPSAAFGRIRINDPGSVRSRRSISSSVRVAAALAASLDGVAGETSPLVSMRRLSHDGAPIMTDYSADFAKSARTSIDASAEAIEIIKSPRFVIWIGPALVCAMCYALYNIFIKKGSTSIHPVLGGVILQFVAALVGSILLIVLVTSYYNDEEGGQGISDLQCERIGVFWAVCAGVSVGMAEILSFIVSGMGVQAMQSIPIIIGGSVLFGTTLGYLLLHEGLTMRGWGGVVLIAAGIGLVGIDPGGAGSVH